MYYDTHTRAHAHARTRTRAHTPHTHTRTCVCGLHARIEAAPVTHAPVRAHIHDTDVCALGQETMTLTGDEKADGLLPVLFDRGRCTCSGATTHPSVVSVAGLSFRSRVRVILLFVSRVRVILLFV